MTPAIIQMREKVKGNVAPASVLYSYQKCRCFYCNRFMPYMTFNMTRGAGYTIDHLFPRSKGHTKLGNSVLACRRCNEKKGDRFPTVLEIVKAWELYQKMDREFIAILILP